MASKSQVAALVVVALAACLAADWTQAQKTVGKQQRNQLAASSNSNSVYGGYGQSAAPARQRPLQQQQQQLPQQFVQQSYKQSSSSSTSQVIGARPQAPRPVPQPQPQPQQSYQQEENSSYESSQSAGSAQQAESDSEPASYGAVAGQPNVDFPAYASVPKTSFSCDGKPFDGFYPDEEAGCQAYHVCWENRHESFLCGVGTLFNAENQHCDYWYNVKCNQSQEHWNLNRFFGTSTPENSATGPTQPLRNSYNSNRQSDSSSQSLAFARPRPQQQQPQQPQQSQLQQQQYQQQEYDGSA